MPVLTITNGLFANSKRFVKRFELAFECSVVTDQDIIEATHKSENIKRTTLQKVFESKQIAFNDFTHEKEKAIIALKKNISGFVSKGSCIFYGLTGQLIPKEVSHVMKVLIIAEKEFRIKNAIKKEKISEKDATKQIYVSDKYAFLWTSALFNKKAWDRTLYDIVIPSDKMEVDEAVALVARSLEKSPYSNKEIIEREAADYLLSAKIDFVLAEIGQELYAKASDGKIVVTIDKKALMLSKLQQKIIQTVNAVEGVRSLETKIGKNYYKSHIIHDFKFETPLRVLLVDDEKEYVQTLSERLKLRQFANEIAYTGEEALDYTDREDIEVILLDLKMPGMDGFEVLKRIKETKPHIEVIILTGHGSEKDRQICMELGAFDYLQKPADIDLITETMKRAYEKIEAARHKE